MNDEKQFLEKTAQELRDLIRIHRMTDHHLDPDDDDTFVDCTFCGFAEARLRRLERMENDK